MTPWTKSCARSYEKQLMTKRGAAARYFGAERFSHTRAAMLTGKRIRYKFDAAFFYVVLQFNSSSSQWPSL